MPENLGFGDDQTPNMPDAQTFARWVQQAQAKLNAGGTLGPNELPTGYKVEGNQLVQDTGTSRMIRDMVLTAIAAFGGAAAFNAFTGTAAPTLEATMNAGVGAPGAGPLAGAETGMAATTASMAPPAALAAPTASSGLASVAPWLKATAPIAATVANRLGQPSGGGNGVSSLDPALMSQLSTLLDMAQKRVASAQPVHDAAMSMAMHMAPTYADSPRLTQAIQDSTTPAPSGSYSAATLAALRNLAGGR